MVFPVRLGNVYPLGAICLRHLVWRRDFRWAEKVRRKILDKGLKVNELCRANNFPIRKAYVNLSSLCGFQKCFGFDTIGLFTAFSCVTYAVDLRPRTQIRSGRFLPHFAFSQKKKHQTEKVRKRENKRGRHFDLHFISLSKMRQCAKSLVKIFISLFPGP